MSDRIKIQRQKQVTPNPTNANLASSSHSLLTQQNIAAPQTVKVVQPSTQDKQPPSEVSPEVEIPKKPPLDRDISRISFRPQARLTVSQPGDIYEQEADSVARQVMRMAEPEPPRTFGEMIIPDVLERQCAASGEKETLQMKPLQRVANDGSIEADSNLESRLNSSQGRGSSLPNEVRTFMEPRFGVDFSSVQVHTDAEAVQMNRELGASAFTYGSDIYFGAGKSSGNNELTAHELTHVVQQNGEAVASRKVIQCYQAGESGHAKIEREGLMLAGFSFDEAADAYLGNWMRDLSQLDMPWLVEILGMGEFGKPIDQQKLGTYVPSEHMDNPEGGDTVEDPNLITVDKDGNFVDKTGHDARLSESQKQDQEAAKKAYLDIKAAAAKNHLPIYIERSKFMTNRKLLEAIKKGDTPEGREEMSSALHAIEDYFSHTNFTEAAISVLAEENPTKYKSLMNKMSALGRDTATVGGIDAETGLPSIISGTYAKGANNTVSQLELLKTELESGSLTIALVKGLIMKAGIVADTLAEKLGEKIGVKSILGTIEGGIGAVGGAVEGGIEGAVSGATTGGAVGKAIGGSLGEEVGEVIGGLFGGVSAGISGAEKGQAIGEENGEQDAEAIIKAAGFVIKDGMVVITTDILDSLLELFPEIAVTLAAIIAMAKSQIGEKLIDAYAKKEVEESAHQAKDKGLTGPTHSQLAKDAPDHPLFDASAALAVEAVRGIGVAMKAAWAQNTNNSPSGEPVGTEEIKNLVDKYICSLDGDRWWQPIIEIQAASAGVTGGEAKDE